MERMKMGACWDKRKRGDGMDVRERVDG